MAQNKTSRIFGSIARTLLGITFIFSGLVKAIDPLGTTYKIEDYLKAFDGIFNQFIVVAEVAAWGLIAFEFILGVCLFLNIRTQITSWLSLVFMLPMTVLTLYIAIKNPVTDCGCFGDALVLSNWATFSKNVVLMILVTILLLTKKYIPQTLSSQVELSMFIIAVCFVFGFMTYARLHLPIKDFRPYKIGNNIPEMMEIPADAEADVYEIEFIYEKDGIRQTFTLDNYPKGDTTWVFVDQVSKLVKKGYEPPIHDFEITTLEGEDVTEDILAAHKAVLIIMYDLSKADLNQMDKVIALLKDSKEELYYCHVLTGSGLADIDELSDVYREQLEEAGLDWEEVFYQTDPVTLKTIVRANPGVIVIQDGTITDKYNLRNRTIEQIITDNK